MVFTCCTSFPSKTPAVSCFPHRSQVREVGQRGLYKLPPCFRSCSCRRATGQKLSSKEGSRDFVPPLRRASWEPARTWCPQACTESTEWALRTMSKKRPGSQSTWQRLAHEMLPHCSNLPKLRLPRVPANRIRGCASA